MPSANSQRYAYSMELATFDPDEEEDADDDLEEDGELGGGLEEVGVRVKAWVRVCKCVRACTVYGAWP